MAAAGTRMKHHSLLAAWIGAAAATAGERILHSPWLSVVGVALASLASVFTIVTKWMGLRQIRLQTELTSQQICNECRDGSPPAQCPYNQRPERCHLRNNL